MGNGTNDEIVLDRRDAIAIIRINRPHVRNALNMPVRRQLAEIFEGFIEDTALRCVVLTGGAISFAAGADIQDMAEIGAIDMYLRHNERLWEAIGRCPFPIIAAVSGFALGGGLELAMHADIIIAGRSAIVGQPEVRVGIMPGAGGTQRLTRAVGKFRAMRLCLTGEIINAEEAFAMGLVSKVVADEDVFAFAMETATQIAKLPPLDLMQIKEVILLGQDASLGAALALERKALQLLFASSDKNEGMRAFLEKRVPHYSGL